MVVYLVTNSKYMCLLFEFFMKGKLVLLMKGACQMFEDVIFMHNFSFMFLKRLLLKYTSTRCFALKIGTKLMSFFHFTCRFILHFCLFYSRILLQIQKCTFILACGCFRALSGFQITVFCYDQK